MTFVRRLLQGPMMVMDWMVDGWQCCITMITPSFDSYHTALETKSSFTIFYHGAHVECVRCGSCGSASSFQIQSPSFRTAVCRFECQEG
jgi:hypothetical protein